MSQMFHLANSTARPLALRSLADNTTLTRRKEDLTTQLYEDELTIEQIRQEKRQLKQMRRELLHHRQLTRSIHLTPQPHVSSVPLPANTPSLHSLPAQRPTYMGTHHHPHHQHQQQQHQYHTYQRAYSSQSSTRTKKYSAFTIFSIVVGRETRKLVTSLLTIPAAAMTFFCATQDNAQTASSQPLADHVDEVVSAATTAAVTAATQQIQAAMDKASPNVEDEKQPLFSPNNAASPSSSSAAAAASNNTTAAAGNSVNINIDPNITLCAMYGVGGYMTGCFVQSASRLAISMASISALSMYVLHKNGYIQVDMERIQTQVKEQVQRLWNQSALRDTQRREQIENQVKQFFALPQGIAFAAGAVVSLVPTPF